MSIKLGANVVPQFKLGILNLNKIMLGAIEIFPNLAPSGGFDPSDLFAANDDGLYYNYTLMDTIFQSVNSMEPITTVELPIGLTMDGSKKFATGVEMLANNDFDNGWTLQNPNAIIVGTELVVNQPTAANLCQHPVSPTWILNAMYEITFVISAYTSGSIFASDVFAGAAPVGVSGVGTHKQYYFCQRVDFPNTRLGAGAGGFVGTVASVSIKRVEGNAATQLTATSRFLFSARKNLASTSQWNGTTAIAGVNNATNSAAPDGTMTAAKLQENAASGVHSYAWGSNVDSPRGQQAYSMVVKPDERTFIRLSHSDTGAWAICDFDLINMVVGNEVGCTGTIVPHPLGGGWVICTLIRTRGAAGGGGLGMNLLLGIGVDSYQGVSGYGVHVAWQQSEMGNVRTSYQSVISPTDYDTNGFLSFARSDGIDDRLSSVLLSTSPEFTVFSLFSNSDLRASGREAISNFRSNLGWAVGQGPAGQARLYTGTGTSFNTDQIPNTFNAGQLMLVMGAYDGTNTVVRLNSGARLITPRAYVPNTVDPVVLGQPYYDVNAGMNGAQGVSFCIDRYLTEAEQDQFVLWVESIWGNLT